MFKHETQLLVDFVPGIPTSFIFIEISSTLSLTRTGIKPQTSLKIGHIIQFVLELLALEHRNIPCLTLP